MRREVAPWHLADVIGKFFTDGGGVRVGHA
jgi:hypothetical protein